MSELPRHADVLPATNEPLRIAVRRMRWFRAAFQRFVEATGQEIGSRFVVDDAKLAAIFVRWMRAVEAQKPSDRTARRDYFEFAAGLMLRELTGDMPVTAATAPGKAKPDSAAAFWPEGYVCTMFCLTVHSAAMAQEFHAKTEFAPAINDLRHWWSFKENADQDSRFSVGFLRMMLGNQPDWVLPDVFRARLQQEVTGPHDEA
jgi:hypothetical protein